MWLRRRLGSTQLARLPQMTSVARPHVRCAAAPRVWMRFASQLPKVPPLANVAEQTEKVADKVEKNVEALSPEEYRAQMESAGYIMHRQRKLSSPLSSVQTTASASGNSIASYQRSPEDGPRGNASEFEDDEAHARLETALAALACVSFVLWCMMMYIDAQRYAAHVDGQRGAEQFQTGSQRSYEERDNRVRRERQAALDAYTAAERRAEARQAKT